VRKTLATILIILGFSMIVATVNVQAFPQWVGIPGGIILAIIAAFVGVTDLASKLKNARDLFFGDGKKDTPTHARRAPAERKQMMIDSPDGEQTMKGKGGKQTQEMKNSERGKQRME